MQRWRCWGLGALWPSFSLLSSLGEGAKRRRRSPVGHTWVLVTEVTPPSSHAAWQTCVSKVAAEEQTVGTAGWPLSLPGSLAP